GRDVGQIPAGWRGGPPAALSAAQSPPAFADPADGPDRGRGAAPPLLEGAAARGGSEPAPVAGVLRLATEAQDPLPQFARGSVGRLSRAAGPARPIDPIESLRPGVGDPVRNGRRGHAELGGGPAHREAAPHGGDHRTAAPLDAVLGPRDPPQRWVLNS